MAFDSHPRNDTRLEWLALAVIILCGLWVRLGGIFGYYYHTDELVHAFIANGHNLSEVLARGLKETHPPLGHFIRHAYNLIFEGIIASRLLSAASGLVAVAVAWRIGRKISPETGLGLVLAFMVALSNISVIYTTVARNYCFFIAFFLLTYYFFLCYAQTRSRRHLYLYLLFSLCTCLTHFSGYIFTFVLMLSLAVPRLQAKDYKGTLALPLLHLPHLFTLLVMVYLYYMRSQVGQGWYGTYSTLSAFTVLRDAQVAIGFMALYHNIFIPVMPFFVPAMVLSAVGMVMLWKQNRLVCISISIAITVQVVLALLHVYPVSGGRYSIYLYLFLVLPLAKFFDVALGRLSLRPALLAFIAVALSALAVSRNFYFAHNPELPNTNASFYAALDYVQSHTQPGDVIVTNKGSWLHVLYLKDRHNSGYFPQPLGIMDYEGRTLVFLEKTNFWEYIRKDDFYEFLPLAGPKIAAANNVWVMVLGTSDYVLNTVYECDEVKPHIEASYQDQGVLMFRLDKAFATGELLSSRPFMDNCFAHSKVHEIGN